MSAHVNGFGKTDPRGIGLAHEVRHVELVEAHEAVVALGERVGVVLPVGGEEVGQALPRGGEGGLGERPDAGASSASSCIPPPVPPCVEVAPATAHAAAPGRRTGSSGGSSPPGTAIYADERLIGARTHGRS